MRDSRKALALLIFCGLLLTAVVRAQTGQVQVIPDNNHQSASISPLAKTVKITSAASCVSAETLKTYPNTLTNLVKSAICTTGYLQGTILSQKINDVSGSISTINTLLASLDNTENYLKSFSAINLNGISFEIIPAGLDEAHPYPSASNITMMCLNDASQDITKDIEAVGTGSSDTADIFNPLPAIALTKMQELRDNNTKMKNMLNSITLSKWTFMTSGLSSSAAATVNAQSNLMGSTLQLAQTNQAIASQYFIPITTTDLIKNYPGFHNSKQYISTSMAWVGGKRELKNMTKLPQSILEIIDKYIPRSQLPKQTTHILLNVDGQTATSWLPEADLFQQIKDTITTHRTQYLKLKTAYQTALAALQAEQAALIKNNYNCQ